MSNIEDLPYSLSELFLSYPHVKSLELCYENKKSSRPRLIILGINGSSLNLVFNNLTFIQEYIIPLIDNEEMKGLLVELDLSSDELATFLYQFKRSYNNVPEQYRFHFLSSLLELLPASRVENTAGFPLILTVNQALSGLD